MKTKTKGLIALIVVIVAAIYYYVTIPAINIHSTDTWGAVLFLIVIALIVKLFFYGFRNPAKIRISDLKESKILSWTNSKPTAVLCAEKCTNRTKQLIHAPPTAGTWISC